jgi:hypothetical protein
MKNTLLICSALLLLSASCKKDNDDQKTRKDYLTSGNWFIRGESVTVSSMGTDSTYDRFAVLPSCGKDNFVTFKTDFTAAWDEGESKCDPGDPQVSAGTWMFIDNDSKLVLTQQSSLDTVKVLELNASTLKIEASIESLGVTYSQITTFAH